jgi:hypothetical protein
MFAYNNYQQCQGKTGHAHHFCLSLDISPSKLDFVVKRILTITIISCNKINNEHIFDYIAKYWDELIEEKIMCAETAFNLFSINMNVVKYPFLVEKYKNNQDWLLFLCRNPYFIDYFKQELHNGIIDKMETRHWMNILKYNARMFDIISECAHYLNATIDETIMKTRSLYQSFGKIGNSFDTLSNPGWFIEDIEKMVDYKKVFFEELMARTWSPSRIKKLIDYGIDPDDF